MGKRLVQMVGKRWDTGKTIRREEFGKIKGLNPVYVITIKDLENVKKDQGIIIASLGKRKKTEIINGAKKKGIIILNRYKEGEKINAIG